MLPRVTFWRTSGSRLKLRNAVLSPVVTTTAGALVDPARSQCPLLAVSGLQVASAFENFGDGILTRREREVVRMVLRGHSSNSIGRHFQITTGTVKI